jgi:diaminohydroxyphosphoribosylaminopyrimidine deaminase/5-amino-6-(5-phosphoribosylamino)uracil reductase
MTSTWRDHVHMAHALQLAQRGLYTTDPNPRVGCVVVANDDIVGAGWHALAGGPHAEIEALRAAGGSASGATAYVTLEPCCHHGRTPPCTDALLEAGIARVVMACRDPNPQVGGQGAARLEAAGVEVASGVLEREAHELNIGYMQRMRDGRPWVRSKIAASLDGRTALANGVSKWITGDAARADVQRLRARSSAILTGAGTIVADDPSLNVRATELGDVVQPIRVIVDSGLRVAPDARILKLDGETVIVTVAGAEDKCASLEQAGARIEVVEAAANGRVDLDAAMARLADIGVNELLVEAGTQINGALLHAGLIDELVVYTAGSVLGRHARGMFDIPELTRMDGRVEFELSGVRRVGKDLRTTWLRREGKI